MSQYPDDLKGLMAFSLFQISVFGFKHTQNVSDI